MSQPRFSQYKSAKEYRKAKRDYAKNVAAGAAAREAFNNEQWDKHAAEQRRLRERETVAQTLFATSRPGHGTMGHITWALAMLVGVPVLGFLYKLSFTIWGCVCVGLWMSGECLYKEYKRRKQQS